MYDEINRRIELDIIINPEGQGRDKIYSISSVQFPNVVTQGKTIDEAIKRLKEALELYFESAPWEKKRIMAIEKDEDNSNRPMISRIFL